MSTCLVVIAVVSALAGCLDGGALATDGDGDPDRIDPTCTDTPRLPPTVCGAPQEVDKPEVGAKHISTPTPIVYADSPPSSGDHRPAWAKWGEYDYLGPQRWLHNLEHGGIALLYDPCTGEALAAALRAFARARPDDETGPFRWILTPYPDLPTPIAAVAWEHTWLGECVDVTALGAWVDAHYRKSPEDLAADGSYTTGWLGR